MNKNQLIVLDWLVKNITIGNFPFIISQLLDFNVPLVVGKAYDELTERETVEVIKEISEYVLHKDEKL